MEWFLSKIRRELKRSSSPEARVSGQRFFKEKVKLYGVPAVLVKRIGAEQYRLLSDKSKEAVFQACEHLWRSGYLEEGMLACDWSYRQRKNYARGDITVFERWIREYVNNWATCDTLCNHTVGTWLEMYPDEIIVLEKWAQSRSRWFRRAAAVSLIVPARKGMFLPEIFEIALVLLEDQDDLVQKGYGWMLKAASEAHQKEVFGFVTRYKNEMPRTALRYAIEKMPKEMKLEAIAK